MTDYSKITALYSRLSVGDEDRDGGESNSMFLAHLYRINKYIFFFFRIPRGIGIILIIAISGNICFT